ncbi:MAG TPA: 2'-5' RNA ligase family protein [Xanthomonadaceae bacterium]|jgi:2'-5' RNA ligase|nr:2'-5' RNA ligase family protein [Xanthomonadaceae bacterium]
MRDTSKDTGTLGDMAIHPAPSGGSQSVAIGRVETTAKDRLFLGVFPDRKAQQTIGDIAQGFLREHGMRATPQHASRLHVTVHHLGDYAELRPGIIDAALLAMAQIQTAGWNIVLDRITGFSGQPRHHPIVLHCASKGAHALWRESRDLFEAEGFSRWLAQSYTPHLTLFYGDRPPPPIPIPIRPILWPVREVVLVHSLLGKSEYRFLGSRELPEA